jgi:hypothetical protein
MAYWLPTVVAVLSGLFSGLGGRRLEAWLSAPKLEVDFIPDDGGFRTEGSWNEGPVEVTQIYIRARVRNVGAVVAKQCRPYLVKLEEVQPSGTTSAELFDSCVLHWPGYPHDFAPRDIPKGINQFFDIVGVFKNRPGWRFAFGENFSSHRELAHYRGTYRFKVLVTGDGVKPAGRKIDVTYNGEWNNLRAVDAGRV